MLPSPVSTTERLVRFLRVARLLITAMSRVMHKRMIVENRITARAFTFAVTVFISAMAGGAQAQSANANDTARLLAGMQPAPGSSLLALTKEHAWQQHANRLNALFAQVENRQLARIRSWSRAKITTPSPVLFYMFSGPDFLYANAFFPNASIYVMSGLEPTGPVPDLTKLSRDSLAHGLRGIEESLNSILTYSFFQTIDMRRTLAARSMPGTLPILYVFLARSGKVIRDVSLVRVDEDGAVHIDDASASADAKSIQGVKVDFVGDDARQQTLYYFTVNIDNDGFKNSGFMRFCERLGTGEAFVKSASYLMHRDHFSEVRNFLLEHSRVLLQDDSGIPVTRFDQARWQLHLFGHYSGPIGLFANRYQSKLAQLFERDRVEPIEFGIGYRWRPQTSNLMLAVKTDAANDAVATAHSVSGQAAIVGEDSSDVNRVRRGNEAETHKLSRRGRLRHGAKVVRAGSRARSLHPRDGATWSFWSPTWQ
jgi:hypothetical protein